MSCCPNCGRYDLDWWTDENERVLLCEVCGYSEREPIQPE